MELSSAIFIVYFSNFLLLLVMGGRGDRNSSHKKGEKRENVILSGSTKKHVLRDRLFHNDFITNNINIGYSFMNNTTLIIPYHCRQILVIKALTVFLTTEMYTILHLRTNN